MAAEAASFKDGTKDFKFFSYTLQYHPGKQNNVADALSRIDPSKSDNGVPDPVIGRIVKSITSDCLTWNRLKTATRECKELNALYKFVESDKSHKQQLPQNLSMYKSIFPELYIEDHVILREDRVVVPVSVRAELLKQAHAGHPGCTRMKRKLRTAYWWPGMDDNIDKTVKSCAACENSEKSQPKSPYQTTAIPRPTKPWEKLAIDITGPFSTAPQTCKYAAVIIDYFSSYPEVLWTKEATSETLISWLSEIFARFGNPHQLVSDNGPQFTSAVFTNFLANRGIKYHRTPNYCPNRNGLVERFNGTLKRSTQTYSSHLDWKCQFLDFIANFRATPLSSGQSPSQLLFGGRNNRLPYEYYRCEPRVTTTEEVHNAVRHDSSQGEGVRRREDNELRGRVHHPGPFKRGDLVRVKLHVLKGQCPYTEPREVKKVLGYWTYELSDGKAWNARRLKRHHVPTTSTDENNANLEADTTTGSRYHLRANPKKTERLLYNCDDEAESVLVQDGDISQ